MARSRNIKPGFFENPDLADLGPIAQLLFAGLWCQADREGRLKDDPRRLKAKLFGYYAADVNGELTKLERSGFILRYTAAGVALIQVIEFQKHQSPHNTEKASEFPTWDERDPVSHCSDEENKINGDVTVISPSSNDGNRPDSLIHRLSDSPIPDSPIPDSLIPASLIPDSGLPLVAATSAAQKMPRQKKPKDEKEKTPIAPVWEAYAAAYSERYGCEPTRNVKVNSQLAQYVQRVPIAEAAPLAAWYVSHNKAFYVSKVHPVGLLLQDAEALRTQWRQGHQVTGTEALQTDKTQTNANVFGPLLAQAEARERAQGGAGGHT